MRLPCLASCPPRGRGSFYYNSTGTPFCVKAENWGAGSGDRKRLCRWIQSLLRRLEADSVQMAGPRQARANFASGGHNPRASLFYGARQLKSIQSLLGPRSGPVHSGAQNDSEPAHQVRALPDAFRPDVFNRYHACAEGWVDKTEEKGSDVNLASHLLRDTYTKRFEVAVLITNDSDLA